MSRLSHVYFIQQGSSSTLQLSYNDRWYVVHEVWERSRLLRTEAVAGPYETPEEAEREAEREREARKQQ